MTTTYGANGRAPRQARSLATHNRIRAAGSVLLAEAGWAGFTIEAIARRAGVSVGAIYRRFGDKEGVFKAVHDEHLTRFEERVAAAFSAEPGEPRAAVHEAVVRLGLIFEELGVLNGVLLANAARFPALGEHGALVMARVRERVLAVLRACSPHAGPDGEVAVGTCYRLAFATFSDFAAGDRAPGQRHEMSWPTLIAEVARACTGYLFDPRAPVTRRGTSWAS